MPAWLRYLLGQRNVRVCVVVTPYSSLVMEPDLECAAVYATVLTRRGIPTTVEVVEGWQFD